MFLIFDLIALAALRVLISFLIWCEHSLSVVNLIAAYVGDTGAKTQGLGAAERALVFVNRKNIRAWLARRRSPSDNVGADGHINPVLFTLIQLLCELELMLVYVDKGRRTARTTFHKVHTRYGRIGFLCAVIVGAVLYVAYFISSSLAMGSYLFQLFALATSLFAIQDALDMARQVERGERITVKDKAILSDIFVLSNVVYSLFFIYWMLS